MANSLIDIGSGFPILFAHGTRFNAGMFLPQIEILSKNNFRCISLNSRALSFPPKAHTLTDLVDDTLEFLDGASIKKIVLVGMSVGAFMALEFALKHEDRLAGLILISGHAGAFDAIDRRNWRKAFQPLNVEGKMSAEMAQAGAAYCFGETTFRDNPDLPAKWVEHWQQNIYARSVWHQFNSWVDKRCLLEPIKGVSVPALVIHGLEDRVLSVENAREMAENLANSTFLVINGAGHTVNLENPAVVNAEILSFLNKLAIS